MHDLLLKNGRLLDPSTGRDEVVDVGITAERISGIGTDLAGRHVEDIRGFLLTPGLIDLHTHLYWGATSLGVDANLVARRSACTTLVDAGTAGAANIAGLREFIVSPALPRVLAYINISFPGIYAFSAEVMVGECADERLLHPVACLRAAREHADIVVGVKARVGRIAGGNSGIGPLDVAIEVAEELGCPVMAHLDFPPPGRKEVLDRLRPGDVLTHCFRPFPNAPVRSSGVMFDEVRQARDRGVVFDIGHGMGSLGFETSRMMLDQGFLPDTISSDVHQLCINGPAYDLLVTMSKFLCLGMSLMDVVRCATSNAAAALRRPELGRMEVGGIADLSVLRLDDGDFTYVDAQGCQLQGRQRLFPVGMVRRGQWHPLEGANASS